MKPNEIALLKQQSPMLAKLLKEHQYTLWKFLRDKVLSRYGYWPQGFHHCEQCGKTVYPTLGSPYNCFNPGWCIDCVLQGFLDPSTPLYVPYQHPPWTKEQVDRLIQYKREHPRKR